MPLSRSGSDAGAPLELTVAADEAGLRLDQLVRRRLPGLSRRSLARLLEARQILVDGRRGDKGERLRAGQQVVVAPGARSERPVPQPELELDVLAVLPDLVAVNKAAGPPCHPLVPGETETVATLTWPAPIGTFERMYFAAWNPFWKTRLSTAPTTPWVVARA